MAIPPSNEQDLAVATIRGTLWTYATFYSGKFLTIVSTTILAWLLTKEDFGVAGYAIVVINFLGVLSDMGIGAALIYHKDEPRAADTAFWLNVGVSSILFLIVMLGAPLVGVYFNDMRAVPFTRVLALSYLISAISNVHNSLLRKNLSFKQIFIPDLIQALSKGVVSIVLALLGFGPWSLVYGQLSGQFIAAVVYWIIYPWRPSFVFARHLARTLLSYGVGMIGLSALAVFLLNVDYLFVGRHLGASALGVYTLAFRIPELLIKNLYSAVEKVIFPVYTKLRDDIDTLREAFLTTLRYVSIVTFPVGVGLILVAEPLVLTVFSDKWIEVIPVMRAISVYALVKSLVFNAGDFFKAQGKLGILTRLSLLRAFIMVPALWWAVTRVGTLPAVGWTVTIVVAFTASLNLTIASRMFSASFADLFTAIRPALISVVIMAFCVLGAMAVAQGWSAILQLSLTIPVGGVIYFAALWFVQRQIILDVGSMLQTALARK